jgi:hypothetical protein
MIIIDNTLCEVFESMEIMALRAQADVVLVYLVYAGWSRGATLEHLAKIWRIPLDGTWMVLGRVFKSPANLVFKSPALI